MQNHTSALPVHLQEKCQYPSKSCPQRRALKVDGELHRLCEFHRQLANRNQQRLQQRRRMLRQEKEDFDGRSSSPSSPEVVSSLGDSNRAQNDTFSQVDGLGELALEDLEILLQLLNSDTNALLGV